MADREVIVAAGAKSGVLSKSESYFDLGKDTGFGRDVTGSTDVPDGALEDPDLEDCKDDLQPGPEKCALQPGGSEWIALMQVMEEA
eukprot:CAMPEP_0197624870 /NCGR_PEP_ID=MMETSP1338-20131121/4386_1 /TAXON_ID=43686 ORGANISM="Pelagodinium beii, Strain RCC1491" /NCGR_SAMPLE_ID=MMETSP1338 /ASSEMBLY_ACC=CAM_ASM_000754 /LENGTH=85 /DNA_ID=CAMNT_0043195121 /DNA_START=69 /DNA_END=322 /DNA_ORIENTATION=+